MAISRTLDPFPPGTDPVPLFEEHRRTLRRQKTGANLLIGAVFFGLLGWSLYVSNFNPERLAEGLRRIFEYFETILPSLERDKLFLGRDEAGRAVPGSLTFWFADLDKYLRLIGETLLMAVTSTMLGAMGAFALSFTAARNLSPNRALGTLSRRVLEFFRGVPEILYALVLVFAVGVGPLAGVLAIAIHSAGALGKLFAEVNENASLRAADGIRATGGTWFDEIRYGVVPQVLPNFISYTLVRFEINVRASAVVGFVGAGGIGMELNRVISFYSDDRVLAVLVLIVFLVTIIDLLSERLRHHFIGRENFR